ncbi:hypothetical protein F511_30347 [Dorcoceras hygrometricum]|uniref:Uncharacterized protein n=1 Tax=Dorcoceras hygrometricum TaxID=472368 RepID=A0A2Z7BLL4_9LAMI|nr:hypothetical protein F511_30347 [Dorcoceras hygrometricum]
MVSMFEALLLSGLSGFLGCSSAIYEADLVEFFHNASVRDAPTADYLHSMKTNEPKAQQFLALWLMVKGYIDPSTYTPDPSSVERAYGSSAAHSPFLWGPS